MVVIGEIIEYRQARDMLVEFGAKYRSLVEFTADSIYMINRDRRYLFINSTHLSRLGFSTEEAIGKTYDELHSEEETKEFAEKVNQVFETGNSIQHEHRSRRNGGYFFRTLSPVKDLEGRITAVTVVSKDATEHKEADERQAQLLKEVEATNKELEEFAYIVAHDLKSPLLSITALAGLLAEDYKDKLDDDGREQLDMLVSKSARMQNLIDGILRYSRVGRLKADEVAEAVDLNTLVSEVIDMISPPESIRITVINELPTLV